MSPFAASLKFCVCLTGLQPSSQVSSRHRQSQPELFGASVLRSAHTARLSRSLRPPSPTAGSAPVTRSAWVTRRSNPLRALEKKERTSNASRQPEAFQQRVWSCEATSSTFGRFHSDSTSRVGIAFHVVRLGIPIRKKRLTMALQPTAPAVTVAAILARTSLVRSWLCPTSVTAFFVPPSQLPRRAPQSLSLSR